MIRKNKCVGKCAVTLYCNHPEEGLKDTIRDDKSVGEYGVTLYCNPHEEDKRT